MCLRSLRRSLHAARPVEPNGSGAYSGCRGLRPARRERPSTGGLSGLACPSTLGHRPGPGRSRLRGPALAPAVGTGRRPRHPTGHRRRAPSGRPAPARQPHRDRVGRSHPDPCRTDRPTGALSAPAALGRGVLVPAVQRARRRLRPGCAFHPGRARRRGLGGDRPEGLDLVRPSGRIRHPVGPDRRRRRPSSRASPISSARWTLPASPSGRWWT